MDTENVILITYFTAIDKFMSEHMYSNLGANPVALSSDLHSYTIHTLKLIRNNIKALNRNY